MDKTVIMQPEKFNCSPFELIGKEWLLLAAENGGKVNAMTCSWGGMGVLWNKNVVFIFVRHSRYTFEFIEAAERFSLSWLDDPEHKLLRYFGSVSGRDEDKIAKSGLTQQEREGAPYFKEATMTMLCKKLYAQDIPPESFVDKSILESCYGSKDYHRMYIGEIIEIEKKN